ncbi:preprotein translocase subunit SecF [Actinocorallia herbida]|uniref:Protein-export membrane protein SecF n=1 Tax=Actinocorallia herbida TaxID=58109 RepID=A0A3N1CSS8_9ACTN|nr:protein translocase subunit SecF [Actinocorallia herbida]ROO84376.1 preprotein translocase subunit SecF [Actinocorallia herbida]
MSGVIQRFMHGELATNIVGRPKLWYAISGALILFSIAGLLIRGLHPGVEFTGGSVFTIEGAAKSSISQVRDAVAEEAGGTPIVQEAGGNWRVTTHPLTPAEITAVQANVATDLGVERTQVNAESVGSTWGGDVTKKAWQALVVFMILIIVYLSVAFEWRMALAAVVALFHDLIITAGFYAWSGFEVTPATLLGFLTILGYSLYDAVVVFDMIKEVTKPLNENSRITYSQAANQALSSTLVRSLNTSLVAILPVAAILFIGTTLLGAGTLKDLSLALFIGMIVGTYSSICVATPLLVQLKEREPMYVKLRENVARRAASPKRQARAAKTADGEPDDDADDDLDDEESPDADAVAEAHQTVVKVVQSGPRNQPRKGTRSSRRP